MAFGRRAYWVIAPFHFNRAATWEALQATASSLRLTDGFLLYLPLCKTWLSKLQSDNTALLYTGVIVIAKKKKKKLLQLWERVLDLCHDSYTGRYIVPNFSFWDYFVFYLPLQNLECKVLCLHWSGRLPSLKIHTDICSPFELGQCLVFFFFFSSPSISLASTPPDLKGKCYSFLERWSRCTTQRPFSPVHSGCSTRVLALCKNTGLVPSAFHGHPSVQTVATW